MLAFCFAGLLARFGLHSALLRGAAVLMGWEFLRCAGGTNHMQYILDPKFKEQFEVAHPTARYHKVMEGVGQEVLATPDRLTKVSKPAHIGICGPDPFLQLGSSGGAGMPGPRRSRQLIYKLLRLLLSDQLPESRLPCLCTTLVVTSYS